MKHLRGLFMVAAGVLLGWLTGRRDEDEALLDFDYLKQIPQAMLRWHHEHQAWGVDWLQPTGTGTIAWAVIGESEESPDDVVVAAYNEFSRMLVKVAAQQESLHVQTFEDEDTAEIDVNAVYEQVIIQNAVGKTLTFSKAIGVRMYVDDMQDGKTRWMAGAFQMVVMSYNEGLQAFVCEITGGINDGVQFVMSIPSLQHFAGMAEDIS